MSFSAADAIESLDWDFHPYVKAEGTTPEPTDEQVRQMNRGMSDAVKRVTGEDFDPDDRKAAAAVFAKVTDEQMKLMDDDTVAAIAIVTGNSPSPKQIMALPYRIRRAYIKQLVKDVNDPEA